MKLLQINALLLTTVLGLTACDKQKDAPAPKPDNGLVGTWQLTARQCFCAPGVPSETAVFTGNTFSFYQGNSLISSGTYTYESSATLCGLASSVPALHFTYAAADWTPAYASFTLDNNQLVLDYGSPCDHARDTYTWAPR